MKRLVIALTGASGVLYGIRLLEYLHSLGTVHISLIISEAAKLNIGVETAYTPAQVAALANVCYDNGSIYEPVASGSHPTDGMVVCPCSMKTLAAIAHGYSENLIVRAADTTLKEGRKLILCPRETPLSAIHLENMLTLARLGVGIIPPMPGLYTRPETVDDIVAHHVMKVADYLGLPHKNGRRWEGLPLPPFQQ